MQDVPMRDLRARQVWWAFVVAGVRSKVGATLLVLGLGLSAWLFATVHVALALVELAILALFYARIPVAVGIVLGTRGEPRQR
jgi:predicted cobalt transporter CbtA